MTSTIPATTQLAVALFDVELDGGDTGIRQMRGDVLPAGAIVLDALARIDGVFTVSGHGTRAARADTRPPRLKVAIGDRNLIGPLMLQAGSWPVGRAMRSGLAAQGGLHTVDRDQPVTVGIESGGAEFVTGSLTVVVTYLALP